METTSEHKIGVVLINIGTPATPDPRDIKPYLIEFLSDKNVVRIPHPIWLPILHGVVARTRPKKTSPRYQRIWTDKGAPLIVESYSQRDALNKRFAANDQPFVAEVGMRYGKPSIEEALISLEKQGCTHIIGLPLFPQTAFCTVETCKEKIAKVISTWPKIHPDRATLTLDGVIEGYSQNPLYPKAVAQSIQDHWEWTPGSKILFSMHSIPLNDVSAGDTCLEEIQDSMQEVATLLSIPDDDWTIAYHSRFEDSRAWAAPHPKTVLADWAEQGVSRIALATPGFASDCLESLYDIAIVAKEYFEERCKERNIDADVTYVPALNSRDDHIDLLYNIIVTYQASLIHA